MVYRRFDHELELDRALRAFNEGQIDETLMREAVEAYILAEARSDFDIMTRGRERDEMAYAEHPDHLARTDFFAYALSKGIFSPKEVSKIPFDHGDNVQIFVRRHEKNLGKLVSSEVARRVYGYPLETLFFMDDPHPACDCEY